ncbi:MAG: hypothetical protein IT357_06755 [Gemmatimonadaceae bacterium]|nr:hypothetical protein [Gemmatimonadaceae bacterium]
MPTARLHRTHRAVTLALAALLLGACESAEQPTVEPETWRRYNLVRFDTSALPAVIVANGADTTYLAGGRLEFRVDGSAAMHSDYLYSGHADTVSNVWLSEYSLGPDSLYWGAMRIALVDTTLALSRRIPPLGALHYRLDPTSRLAP